jgi:hypothetical protein
MTRRQAIEAELAAWREADRVLDAADGNATDEMRDAVEQHRAEFQRLTSEHMIESIDRLKDAEQRRSGSTPSTPAFHKAAREEQEIAREIWDVGRTSDEDTPKSS